MLGKKILIISSMLVIISSATVNADEINFTQKEYQNKYLLNQLNLSSKNTSQKENSNVKNKKIIIKNGFVYKDEKFSVKKSKILEGESVEIVFKNNQYYIPSYDAYVKKEIVGDNLEFKKVEGEITFDKISNIYEKADITSKIVDKFLVGEKVSYSEKTENWIKVNRNGKEGYVLINSKEDIKDSDTVEVNNENMDVEVEENEMEELRNLFESENSMSTYYSNTPYNSYNANVSIVSDNTNSDTGLKRAEMISKKGKHVFVDYKNDLQRDLIKLALEYEGNPYIWGGNSLTNGIDCSGFTRELYKKLGYLLPRTSSSQRYIGTKVSLDKLQAGDLIHFKGHVALYIGGGKMIHASSPRVGIIISSVNYGRNYILSASRIIN